ncbi:MAG TPA: hypothetical protein VFC19_34490 [Candidatus Limnocylindrales bacterium]|nr:hypothetical protein [Candidatus Limnocylindrales bacterium]
MSYYGTVVMTRAEVVMSRLPGIEAIGFRHRRLRELGGGWQVLETSGGDDPPDLEQAVGEAARSWKAPVFAAYVADVCTQIHGAQFHGTAADTATWSGHLPDPAEVNCGMLHRPSVPAGGTMDSLQAQIVGWAAGAGLTLSQARLGRALRYLLEWRDDSDGPYLDRVDQVFEVVRAFGFPVIPAPRAYEFDPHDLPFADVAAGMWGLAARALAAAAYRRAGIDETQPAHWEAEAITLERDLYASLYGGGHPVAELAARAEWVSAAYDAAQQGAPPPPSEITVKGHRVTNVQRITHDLGRQMIANQRAVIRAHGAPRPNGTVFTDPTAGPGIWPCLD